MCSIIWPMGLYRDVADTSISWLPWTLVAIAPVVTWDLRKAISGGVRTKLVVTWVLKGLLASFYAHPRCAI
jgi:hypothetical protein